MVLLPLDTVCLDEITRTVAAMLPPAQGQSHHMGEALLREQLRGGA